MRNFSQQKEAYSEPSQTSKSQNLDFHNLDIRHGSEYAYDTSNPPKVFCKKSVLKNFTNLQENNWNGVLFSKVAVLFLKLLYQKNSIPDVLLWVLWKFSKLFSSTHVNSYSENSYFKESCGWVRLLDQIPAIHWKQLFRGPTMQKRI